MDYIRKFTDYDLPKVMKIWYEGNLEAHDFVPKQFWDRHINYVSRAIKEAETYVYEIDGQVIGFIGMDHDYLAGLFIHREFRGQGYGSRLLNFIKEKYDSFTLHVFENNYGAYCFYENQGLIKQAEEVNEDLGEVEFVMYYSNKKEY